MKRASIIACILVCAGPSAVSADSPRTSKKAPARLARWNELKAANVKVQRGKLLVGLQDGGAAVYDLGSESAINVLKGAGKGQTLDTIWEGNQLWWTDGTDGTLYSASTTQKTPVKIDLKKAGMNQAPLRLGVWQGHVLVQGESDLRVIEPRSKKIMRASEFFPRDIAAQLEQGIVLSTWHTQTNGAGEGQLVVIRRYGKRENPGDKKADIASFTGWTSTGSNYQYLGTYTRSLVDFRDAAGPRVRMRSGRKDIDVAFGTCQPGNIALGQEGIMALDLDTLVTVPLRAKSWLPDEIPLRVKPKYASTMAFYGGSVWWSDGERIYCGNAEDGATDVYLPSKNRDLTIKSMAADDSGAWYVQGTWLKRIEATEPLNHSSGGFARYAARSERDVPESDRRIQSGLLAAPKAGSVWEQISKSLGREVSNESDLKRARKIQGVLETGDVILRGNRPMVFYGNGEAVTFSASGATKAELMLQATDQIYRVIERGTGPIAFKPVKGPTDVDPVLNPGRPGFLAEPAVPRGLGKPKPELGHDFFIRLDVGGKFDKPWLPIHEQFLREAESWIGTPYVWGGNEKTLGCDCSGFVKGVFQNLGINLPRHSQDMGQVAFGEVVTQDLRFGDLLVFPNPKHVALYIGDGKTIEAVKGGVGYSNIRRRDHAVVRRFFLP